MPDPAAARPLTDARPDPAADDQPIPAGLPAVRALLARLGPYGVRLRAAVALLADGPPRPLDALVRISGLSRRTVEELITVAGGDVETADGGYRLRAAVAAAYAADPAVARAAEPDPWHGLGEAVAPEVAAEVRRLVREAPRPRRALDHVAADEDTVLRRAAWLDASYDLCAARLLCVGDHDLTALAACLVHPGLRAAVVDIDEELLAYIDAAADRLGLGVTCRYADLRRGFPAELTGWADVVFTDPPYTPDGVRLFARRGLAALRDPESGHLAVAYGFGERMPTLGYQVQHALHELGVVYEAILPGFNRYAGAQAIGGRSDLYVCRPTTRTARALEQAPRAAATIYTHGPQSAEAHARLTAAAATAVTRAAAPDAAAPGSVPPYVPVLVGDAWPPPEAAGGRGSDGASADAASAQAGRAAGVPPVRVRLDTLLSGGLPRELAHRQAAVAIDLAADEGSALLRVLLACDAARVAVLVPNGHPDLGSQRAQQALIALLAPKYRLRLRRSVPDGSTAIVEADRVPVPETADGAARRYLLERAHARVANACREALVAASRRTGVQPGRPVLTKREARRLVQGWLPPGLAAPPPSAGTARSTADTAGGPSGPRLLDLPRHRIVEVLDRLGRCAAAVAAPPPGP